MATEQIRKVHANLRVWILLVALFAGSMVSVSGEAPATPDQPKELTQIQNATATVTVTGGTTQGTATITFSPAYTVVPKLIVTTQGFFSTTAQIFIPNPTAFFQSGNTQTWLNMPAADTEVYGDLNGEHQIEINLSNMASFRFGVSCITASNTVGAYLTINYFSGGVWTEMNSAQRFFIDNTSGNSCPTAPGEQYGSPSYSTIPTAAKISTTHLRIDGVGGGGIGDVPSFSSLWIDWSSSVTGQVAQTLPITGHWRICATLALCPSGVETLKTGFIIAVSYPIAPAATQTLRFTWKAGVIA